MNKTIVNMLLAVSLLFIAGNAYAYIDPGSGSYVIQIILASFLGAAFTIKTFFKRYFPGKRDSGTTRTDRAIESGTGNSDTDDEPTQSTLKSK